MGPPLRRRNSHVGDLQGSLATEARGKEQNAQGELSCGDSVAWLAGGDSDVVGHSQGKELIAIKQVRKMTTKFSLYLRGLERL